MNDLMIGKENGRIDELIYGQFIEHILDCIKGGIYDPESALADEVGLRTDVVEKIKELHPPVLRFPGGTIMCQYHWEDAIGPMEKRIRRKNLIWGGELDPSFGTAEFIKLCRKLGAEPMMCVNMASGTPEEAANWVEYCNGTGNTYYANLRRKHGYEEPFRVKYWCIGNESYAVPDIGVHHDVQLYIRDAWEFIKFMKLTDKTIQTLIVGCDDDGWNKAVLDALHPVTDYLSYHHYSAEGKMGLYGPFHGEKLLRDQVEKLSKLIDEYPDQVTNFSPWYRFPPRQGKIKIALDEWNIWDFVPDETYGLHQIYNWRDALWTASVLNLLIEKTEIGIANLAQSVNVIAPIVTHEKGSWYQTIAYPLKLYRKLMRGTRLKCCCENTVLDGDAAGDIQAVSLAAVKNDEGRTIISAVNRDFEHSHEMRICFEDDKPFEKMDVITLFADSPASCCSATHSCVHEDRYSINTQTIVLKPGTINIIAIQ